MFCDRRVSRPLSRVCATRGSGLFIRLNNETRRTTHVGGNSDVIIDGHNGILVPPSDEIALADAICRLVSNIEHYKSGAEQERDAAEARFKPRAVMDLYRIKYIELCR